jgi:hypothetical protein
MRSLLARLAVLGAFALSMTACTNGAGSSLPFAGPPNNAGGSPGTIQSGGNGLSLLRFIQGSPDVVTPANPTGTVDVCVDNLPFGVITNISTAYGKATPALYSVPGGIPHTVAVYPGLGGANAGLECPTAPGPYLGTNTIKVITISPAIAPAAGARLTVVLAGTGATLGLYVYAEPIFAIAPAGTEVIVHNASPAFSVGKTGVGFGLCTTTVTPCVTATVLTGSGNVAAPKPSTVLAQTSNAFVASSIVSIPAGFYDGAGVAAGSPVAITSIPAPAPVAGQPYVVQLYSIDGPAGGLNLVGFVEQTLGYGF